VPVTTSSRFTNVSQTDPGGFSTTWLNLANVLADAGDASTFFDANTPCWVMILDTPTFSAGVPPDANITNIRIRIRAWRTDSTPGIFMKPMNVEIAGGTQREGADLVPIVENITIEGDLAFWGITNQQGLDFSNGLEDLNLQVDSTGGGNQTAFVQWVDTQITYISDLIPLPTLF
jgi:hypothetical protein